jgi:cell division protein FtsB
MSSTKNKYWDDISQINPVNEAEREIDRLTDENKRLKLEIQKLKEKNNKMSQFSLDFINNLLENEYNSTDMDDDYRNEIQDVQAELDEIEIKGGL